MRTFSQGHFSCRVDKGSGRERGRVTNDRNYERFQEIERNAIFEIWSWNFVDASYCEIILKYPSKWESAVFNSHFFFFRFLSFPTLGWLDTAPFSVEVLSSSMCSWVSRFLFEFLFFGSLKHADLKDMKVWMNVSMLCDEQQFSLCIIFFFSDVIILFVTFL